MFCSVKADAIPFGSTPQPKLLRRSPATRRSTTVWRKRSVSNSVSCSLDSCVPISYPPSARANNGASISPTSPNMTNMFILSACLRATRTMVQTQ